MHDRTTAVTRYLGFSLDLKCFFVLERLVFNPLGVIIRSKIN